MKNERHQSNTRLYKVNLNSSVNDKYDGSNNTILQNENDSHNQKVKSLMGALVLRSTEIEGLSHKYIKKLGNSINFIKLKS